MKIQEILLFRIVVPILIFLIVWCVLTFTKIMVVEVGYKPYYKELSRSYYFAMENPKLGDTGRIKKRIIGIGPSFKYILNPFDWSREGAVNDKELYKLALEIHKQRLQEEKLVKFKNDGTFPERVVNINTGDTNGYE